jgi:hypothetical protein
VHPAGFYYKNISRCTVLWMSKTCYWFCVLKFLYTLIHSKSCYWNCLIQLLWNPLTMIFKWLKYENKINSNSYQTAYHDSYMKLSTNYRKTHYERRYDLFIPLSKFQFCPSFRTFLVRVTQQILSFVRKCHYGTWVFRL